MKLITARGSWIAPRIFPVGFSLILAGWWALPACGQAFQKLRPGDVYQVLTKEKLDGTLELPSKPGEKPEQLKISGEARVGYRERVIRMGTDGSADRVLRKYDHVDAKRTVKDQPQEGKLRDGVRLVALYRDGNVEKPFSPSGPLEWEEIDLVRTHIFVPTLEGLLPAGQALRKDAAWKAAGAAVAELTGLQQIDSGGLECNYTGEVEHSGRRLGTVHFAGTVQGVSAEGRQRNRIEGALFVNLSTGRLDSLKAFGELEMLDDQGRVVGRLKVDYQMLIQPLASDAELGDQVVSKLPEQPDENQTALVYENPILGARIVHWRRWFLATVQESQVLLKYKQNSVVINFEPDGKTPTTKQYYDEVMKFLEEKKASPKKLRLRENTGVGNFTVEALLEGQRLILDYWVVQHDRRGVTIAARLQPDEFVGLQKSLMDLAYGIEFTKEKLDLAPPKRHETPSGPPPSKGLKIR